MNDSRNRDAPGGGVRLVPVDPGRAGQRLDNFLLGQLKGAPRSLVYKLVRSGQVRVNGGRARPETRLEAGDEVRIPPVRLEAPEDKGTPAAGLLEAMASSIVYEDARLLAINKPAGVASHGGSGIGFGVIETLRALRPGEELELVHRLDRDTSGCLLVARTATAFERAVAVFKTRRVKKLYDVLVVGRLVQPVSTIDTPLDGQPARTHVRRLTANEDVTFARVRIETGRTHQIRLHLASVRHPVVGDRLHGLKLTRDPRLMRVPRQMLHATELELDDPMGSGRLHAHSPLPADFRRCLQMFGLGK